MSGRANQRIGDALYPHFAQSNVSVTEIRTSNAEEGQPSTITDLDTPISVLDMSHLAYGSFLSTQNRMVRKFKCQGIFV